MVNVNSHMMHVYSEGNGKEKLVFMSGGGTCYPTLDFKALYKSLSDKYSISVVEKAGYGFSEVANVSRDIDTILEETREALKLSGKNPPYILFPHSMSGIEALYWAKKYPNEVKGIIGLDMAVPSVYENYPSSFLNLKAMKLGARLGITRLIPSVADLSAAIKENNLTEEEKNMYRAVFYRSTLTHNMFEEMKSIKNNAKKVENEGVPVNTPIYLFISNEKDITDFNLKEASINYEKQLTNSKTMYLDCLHYVHNYKQDIIANESIKFIEEVINK